MGLYFGLSLGPKEKREEIAYVSLGKEFLQHMATHKNPSQGTNFFFSLQLTPLSTQSWQMSSWALQPVNM